MSEAAPDRTGRRLPPPLIGVTPGTLQRDRSGGTDALLALMERAAQVAVASGLQGILLREPALEDGAFLELAQRLRTLLDSATEGDGATGAGWLGLHDRVHLIQAAKADAGHLGGTSLPLPAARAVVTCDVALGVSTHGGDELRESEGADYCLHAPVFAPTSKPSFGRRTLGWSGVEAFAGMSDLPTWGLGGITVEELERYASMENAGARPSPLAGVALIGGLWGSDSSPIDGTTMALRDVGGIARRTQALRSLSDSLFAGAESLHSVHRGTRHV